MSSAWEIKGLKSFPKLEEDIETDVCIVGGGLAGMWSAYLLSKEGKSVVLLEKDKLGQAATLYTTAFITQVIDTDLSDLVSMFGSGKARLAFQTGAEAIEQIERVVKEEKIECEWKRLPTYSYARNGRDLGRLHKEAKEAKRLGFEARIKYKPLEGFENCGAMEVPDQAKYHPMKFFNSLVDAALKNGVRIYEKMEAVEISGKDKIQVLTKSGKTVEARDVIVATYEPFNNPKPTHWKKGMYETYVYGLELPKDVLPEMMLEDLHNPYHYVRVDDLRDSMRMIVGGEDHRAEIKFEDNKSFRALKEYIDDTFPNLDYKVAHKWHGGILEPSDGLPLIGEYEPHQYVASAFSGNGMTYSAISGRILTDLIMKRENPYEELYDPKRKMELRPLAHKFRDYAGEFFGGAIKNLFK